MTYYEFVSIYIEPCFVYLIAPIAVVMAILSIYFNIQDRISHQKR